jgi:hypothetical protein
MNASNLEMQFLKMLESRAKTGIKENEQRHNVIIKERKKLNININLQIHLYSTSIS